MKPKRIYVIILYINSWERYGDEDNKIVDEGEDGDEN